MQTAVLGTGMVGRAIAARLHELGHDVSIGTRAVAAALAKTTGDGPGEVPFAEWSAQHPAISVATFADAAASAEFVVNATPGTVSIEALTAAGIHNLAGKVLLDISNPLDFSDGFPPTLFVKDTDSLAERIQAAFPDTKVVKGLNTLTAALMVHPASLSGGEHSVFVCGDDAAAKVLVTDVLTSFGHTDVIDLGGIEGARGTEMYLPLWLRLMGSLDTSLFNVKVVRDTPSG